MGEAIAQPIKTPFIHPSKLKHQKCQNDAYHKNMANYRRNFIKGGSFFFTAALADRRRSLLVDRIDILREAFRQVKAVYPFHLDAMVILPEHLHCIWTLPLDDADYPGRWRRIKTAFSRSLPNRYPRSRSQTLKNERGIWQRRYWEHTLRDEEDYRRHMDYIHYNPVKHGYVNCVADWPYSTFHRYVEAGIYPNDWAGNEETVDQEFGEAMITPDDGLRVAPPILRESGG
jgi:putative transposase